MSNLLSKLNKGNKVNSFLYDHHDQSNYTLCFLFFFFFSLIKTIIVTGPTEDPVYKSISKHLLETRGLAGEELAARSDSSLEWHQTEKDATRSTR